MSLLMSIILICTSGTIKADPARGLLAQNDDDILPVDDNIVFLISPDKESGPWEQAIECLGAPGKAVCMPEKEYRRLITNWRVNEKLDETTIGTGAYTGGDILIFGGVGLVLGLVAGMMVKR